MERTIERLALLAGVAFIVLVLVGFAIEGSTPSLDDPVDEIVDFYVDNGDQVKVASLLAALGAAALVLFAARLRTAMDAAGDSGLLGTVALAGGIITAAGTGVDAALRFALAEAASDLSADSFHGLYAVWANFFWPMHMGLAILVAATSLGALSSRLLPVWLAGGGFVTAILLVVPVLVVTLIGLVLAALWILATSGLLLRGSTPASV